MAAPLSLSQPSFTSMLQSNIDELRELVACRICIRLMYEPFTTQCGHTFCYSCLRQWFDRDPAVHTRKTCPDCRAQVLHQPAPAYLIREITQTFINTAVLLPPGETIDGHKMLQRDEAEIVEKDKTNQGRDGGLFKGCFRPHPRPLAPIRDGPDGVDRCPMCTWELEDGMCNSCGYTVLDDDHDTYGQQFLVGEDYHSSDDDDGGSFNSDADSFSAATLEEILLADEHGPNYISSGSDNDGLVQRHRNRMRRIHQRSGLPHRRHQPPSLSMSSTYGVSEDDIPSDLSGSPGSLRDFMVDDMAVDHHSDADSDESNVSSQYSSDLHGSGSEAPEHRDPTDDPHSEESSDTTAVNTSFRRSRGRRVATSSPDLTADHSDSDHSSTSSLHHEGSRRTRSQRPSLTSVDTGNGDQGGAGFSPLQRPSEDGVSQNIPIQVDSDSDVPPIRRRPRKRPTVVPVVSSDEEEDEVRGSRLRRKRPTAAFSLSSDEDADDTRGVNISRSSAANSSDHVPTPTIVDFSPVRPNSSRRAPPPNLPQPTGNPRRSRRSSTRRTQTSTDDDDIAARQLDIPERSVHPRALSRSPAAPSSPSLRQTGEQRRERKRQKRRDRLRRQQELGSRGQTLRHAPQLAYIGA
ncbi:MAG: hypothetical protein Q9185_001191 [Variospora sp. 1 TL-2023]